MTADYAPEPDPQPQQYGRTPPHDVDAEQAVLGAMMLSPAAIADVLEVLDSGRDFYRPNHETIYDAILDLYGSGEPVDPITVAAFLGRTGELMRVGGAPFLHTLTSQVPVAGNGGYYARIVRDKAILRRIVDAGTQIVQMGYTAEGEATDVLDMANAALFAASPAASSQDYSPVADTIEGTLDAMDALAAGGADTGILTGYTDMDDLIGGLTGGQMVIIAARPGMGKSTMGLDLCRSASIRHGLTSCIFSLEMTKQEITMRLLSAEAKVSLSSIKSGRVAEHEWTRIAARLPEVAAAPLFIDDSPNLAMTEIRAKARRMKQQHDLRLIVIDYMQLMTSGKKVENRQQEVSEFSRQIKLLAKELDIPVVALSQLNRNAESRSDKRPAMSDLRESGSLEQDADIVILLHREDAYEPESSRPGEADVIVAKHRNGPTRELHLAAQLHFSRFVNMADYG